ncbi:hypothetical protein EV138_0736 [Kribbella voronezhensis]|uniref:ABC-2 type transport system permease protein n=1 Tax=Kribbella voronezhensis TaxID=2512212 RepID=A0A4R7T7V3_9ACTN|nr:DUF6297 family protein [Kribbella voronezhensis]TDU87218.1 hypothetical protein EV138_0736 [Kribbella voronezhensis]
MTTADGPVVFDPADFGAIPRSTELRRWMRKVRRGKADRTIWQQLEDIYVVAFALAMVGATGGNVLLKLNDRSAACTTGSCSWLLDTVPWILVPLLVSTLLRVLLSVGPVSASRATGFWLLATPVDRASLLRPSYRLVMIVSAIAGAVAALVGFALFGAGWSAVGEAAVLTTGLLICTACVTVWAQQTTKRSRWALRVADSLLVVAAIPAIVLAVRPQRGWVSYSPLGEDTSLTSNQLRLLVFGVVALVVAVALVVITARSLNRLSRTSVIAGGELLAGMAGAAITMDISLLADVVAGRHWRTVGRVHSRRGRGSLAQAVIYREFLRILRWPRRLIVGFGLLVVPYAVAGTGYDVLVPIAAGLAGFGAVRPLMDGLRSVCRSIGLVRALGMTLRELRVAMSVVPGLFVLVWVLLAYPAIGSPSAAFAVGVGILTGVVRQASARPPSYSGPLVASPMGAIPPGLFSQPIRGFDLLLLCLAPVLLGVNPRWALIVPSFILAVMFAVHPKQA